MTATSRARTFIGLGAWLAVTFAAAFAGALATARAAGFYQTLARPAWAPPASLFGPVWTVLYALMAVSAWRIWLRHGFRAPGAALWLFLAQLALNALWSWLFFRWQLGAGSFAGILLLGLLIAATLRAFWRLDLLSGALLVPYLAWVAFATALTFAIWTRNPHLLA